MMLHPANFMDVAVLYSGGKDSTLAIEHCIKKSWDIKYLLSVKPTRTDCFLFHFATVEMTKELSKALGFRHVYVRCNVADPKQEATIIQRVVQKDPVDAIILGGTGLQATQIRSIRDAVFGIGTEVFAAHTGADHEALVHDMIQRGYDIRVTQVAAEGLSASWLGRRLDSSTFQQLKELSKRYGFHIGAEGGHYDTLVVDAPFFQKRLEILESKSVMESGFSGYLEITRHALAEKKLILRFNKF